MCSRRCGFTRRTTTARAGSQRTGSRRTKRSTPAGTGPSRPGPTRPISSPFITRSRTMFCPNCPNENLTDYPVCPACSFQVHFTHRPASSPCRCDECASFEALLIRAENLPQTSERSARLTRLINQKRPAPVWCEPCFSDTCAHCVYVEVEKIAA